ncbi:hypothetical protein KAI32_04400 [Candidatus Pacearchaeota archaeon]|nr:hypothetical protein [Candidatus Pacearchaeota archaeon]
MNTLKLILSKHGILLLTISFTISLFLIISTGNYSHQTLQATPSTSRTNNNFSENSFVDTSQNSKTIIKIIEAEHLDSDRKLINDIYNETHLLDNLWSKPIYSDEYIRVVFEKNLNNKNDITIFPRVISGNPKIEIYEVGGSKLIAEFTILNSNQYNKVFLTNLLGEQDSFDLKIINGKIEIDHIIDPIQLFQEDWEGGVIGTNWTVTSGWTIIDTPAVGSYSAQCAGDICNMSTATTINTSTLSEINFTFTYWDDDCDPGDVVLYFYDNLSGWDNIGNIDGGTLYGDDTWYTHSVITSESQYMHSNFAVRFLTTKLGGNENYWIDNIIITLPTHWITGYVENASDGTSPDSRTVRLWNPSTSEEIFGIVGITGEAGEPNAFKIDCKTLDTPCTTDDKLNLTLVNNESGYVASNIVEVTVTTADSDMAPNLTMNSPPTITNLIVEDFYTVPINEIDLTPSSTTPIYCTGIATDYDGDNSISTATAEFYASTSGQGNPDDDNDHYTNSSCEINTSYGTSEEAQINCTFNLEYYSNSDNWQCQINVTDNMSISATASDSTFVNTLLSIGVTSPISFEITGPTEVTPEKIIEIINYGNVKINLSLSGYGETEDDGNSMICTEKNISIDHTKYNITSSNTGQMDLSELSDYYLNLTHNPTIEAFKLSSRENDATNDARNDTYWRVYVPAGTGGSCQGNIIIGATQN